MRYFDLHVHPSLKGGLSTDPKKYQPWNYLKLNSNFLVFILLLGIILLKTAEFILIAFLNLGIEIINKLFQFNIRPCKYPSLAFKWPSVLKFKQIINTQANLELLTKGPTFTVVALIAMEQAYSQSLMFRLLTVFSPLNRKILKALRHGNITYLQLFEADLYQLEYAKQQKDFDIINTMSAASGEKLKVILSIEGAHSLQGKDLINGDDPSTIPENLRYYKSEYKYRFHHLTLGHLTRQAACVHCLGVRTQSNGVDTTPNKGYSPHPTEVGIQPIGWKIIRAAYEKEPYRILIDIKHMSFVSRLQFYHIRNSNTTDGWPNIPLIFSHAGVTGCSFENAVVERINYAKFSDDCDEIIWKKQKSDSGTCFNPWTINLFDDDIIEILKSYGLMGMILDERVLGYGKIPGEYMSQGEVKVLDLSAKLPGAQRSEYKSLDFSKINIQANFYDPNYISESSSVYSLRKVKRNNDQIFTYPREKVADRCKEASHIDYLACNIIHILKVGLQNNFDGVKKNVDVKKCITIGSDLDGIIDAINFPGKSKNNPNNQKDWMTADKYSRLKDALIDSLGKCLPKDSYMCDKPINVKDLVDRIFYSNGIEFLERNYTDVPARGWA